MSSSSLTIPMINELLTSYDNEFSEISQSVHQLIQQLSSSSSGNHHHDTHENDDDDSFEVIQRKIKRQFNSLEHIIQNMETQLSTIQYNQQQQQQFSNFMIMDDDNHQQQIGMVAQSWRRRIDEQYKRQLHSLKVQYQDTIHNLLTPSSSSLASSSNEHHQHEIDIYDNSNNSNNYGENSDDDSDSDSDDDHLSYTTRTNTKKSWFASSKKSNSTMDRDRLLSSHNNNNNNSHNTKNFYHDNNFDYKSSRDETKRLIKQSSNSLNRSLEIARSIEHTGTHVMGQLSDQRSVLERARSQLDVTRDEMVEGSRVLSRMEWRDWVQRVVIVLVILILVLFIVGYLVYQIRRMIG